MIFVVKSLILLQSCAFMLSRVLGSDNFLDPLNQKVCQSITHLTTLISPLGPYLEFFTDFGLREFRMAEQTALHCASHLFSPRV